MKSTTTPFLTWTVPRQRSFQHFVVRMESEVAPDPYLFSGHDIERWLLKTLKAMAVSGNLASGRRKLPGEFQSDVRLIEMLDDHMAWPRDAGLYFVMPSGSRMINNPRFRLQPFYGDAKKELVGLWASFVGLEFVMMVAAPDMPNSHDLQRSLFRPGRITVSIAASRRMIDLSWDDGAKHDPISLQFERSVQA